ncbi:MAG: 4-(cytidine 5'-diphospho)-2-C-methyl-D-erythritol kinase [Eubacteriales bacterium]
MIEITANAKVNLFLEITGKLASGYHTVDTVMQSTALADRVMLDLLPASNGIVLTCNSAHVPTDERNIAYKTARAFLDRTQADCGVSIHIEKNIPSEAGMGGGSADGAAVLLGMNHLCGKLLTDDELLSIAATKGADIPFCVFGGTQHMGGTGTDWLETLPTPELPIVIVKPPRGISTPVAYSYLDSVHNDFSGHVPVSSRTVIDRINERFTMFNRFEETLASLCPESKQLIDFLNDRSHGALLSGSGAAVFAIADSHEHAVVLADTVASEFPDCFVTVSHTSPMGCSIQ